MERAHLLLNIYPSPPVSLEGWPACPPSLSILFSTCFGPPVPRPASTYTHCIEEHSMAGLQLYCLQHSLLNNLESGLQQIAALRLGMEHAHLLLDIYPLPPVSAAEAVW